MPADLVTHLWKRSVFPCPCEIHEFLGGEKAISPFALQTNFQWMRGSRLGMHEKPIMRSEVRRVAYQFHRPGDNRLLGG